MVPDRHFVDELRRLDPDLVAVWHPRLHRFQIRHWVLSHAPGDELDYYAWRAKSALIRTVCERDEEFRDVGFHPLDQRVLYALKVSRKLSLNPERVAREVDASNKRLEDAWHKENRAIAREVAQSIYHHYREPAVDLGQRGAY